MPYPRLAPHPYSVTVKSPGPYRTGFGWVIRKDREPYRCSERFHDDVRDALAEARAVLIPLIEAWTAENGLSMGDVAASEESR